MENLVKLTEQVRASVEAYWPDFVKDLATQVAIKC